MKLYFIPICLIIYLELSCSNNNNKSLINEPKFTLLIDTLLTDESFYISSIASTYKIIHLETREDCYFSKISNIKILNDTIYIFDRKLKSVFLFSTDGEYLSKICKIGRGPGEYNNPSDFDVVEKNNSIAIFDWANRKMNYYNISDGEYITSKIYNYRLLSFEFVNDGMLTFIPFPTENLDKKKDFMLCKFDINQKPVYRHFSYSKDYKGPRLIEFIDGGNFYEGKNDVKFFMNYINTIYSISEDQVSPFIQLKTSKYKLLESDFNDLKKKHIPFILSNKDKLFGIKEYSENQQFILFKFNVGFNIYFTLIDQKSLEVFCTSRIIDDLSNMAIYPIKLIDGNKLLALASMVNEKQLKRTSEHKEIITNNPTLIIYDLK